MEDSWGTDLVVEFQNRLIMPEAKPAQRPISVWNFSCGAAGMTRCHAKGIVLDLFPIGSVRVTERCFQLPRWRRRKS